MVTGGKQMDGFVSLFASIVEAEGIPASAINVRRTTLPGYFRPEKDWDLVVVLDGRLIASVEFKSHVGSFGNNFNNRVEEALGNATDLNTAYREGAFRPSTKPWLGYMMLLEEHKKSTRPVKLRQPHFPAFREFNDASYQRRYELFCTRLVRERFYDSACLIVSPADRGADADTRNRSKSSPSATSFCRCRACLPRRDEGGLPNSPDLVRRTGLVTKPLRLNPKESVNVAFHTEVPKTLQGPHRRT